MKSFRFISAASIFAAILVLQGCGEPERATVALSAATPERKAEFAAAVVRACAGFDGLDAPDVKFGISTNAEGCSVTVACSKMNPKALERALSVAVTNLALDYPGIRFMMDDDGTWKVLTPGDIVIPETGGFGIGGE